MGNVVVLVGPHPGSGNCHYLVACWRKQKVNLSVATVAICCIFNFAIITRRV